MRKRLLHLAKGFAALSFSLLLASCVRNAVQFSASVDGLTSPSADIKKKYILAPGLKDVNSGDLQYKEFAEYVDRVLSELGFTKAENVDDADSIIYLSYGISDPQKNRFSYVLPVWGQTGFSGSLTSGKYSFFGNTVSYSGTTTYTPQYGIAGYMPVTESYNTYQRYMMLDAYDLDAFRKDKQLNQIWKTVISSEGVMNDLRMVVPVLIGASRPYIGKNTIVKRAIEISDNEVGDIILNIMSPGTLGLKIRSDFGTAYVDKIIPGSPADSAGIKENDRLWRINGILILNQSKSETARKLLGRPGDKVAIEFERKIKGPDGEVKREFLDYELTYVKNNLE
jgi:hypothetical protein